MTRRLLIFFLLFWLPLQGWGGSVMPFSRHGGVMWMQAVAVTEAMPCHTGDSQRRDNSVNKNCDGCGLCHLANASAVIVVALQFSPIAGDTHPPAVTRSPPDAAPAALYRPPRV